MAVVAMREKEREVISLHFGLLVREKLIPPALRPEKGDVRSVVGDGRYDETTKKKREQPGRSPRSLGMAETLMGLVAARSVKAPVCRSSLPRTIPDPAIDAHLRGLPYEHKYCSRPFHETTASDPVSFQPAARPTRAGRSSR